MIINKTTLAKILNITCLPALLFMISGCENRENQMPTSLTFPIERPSISSSTTSSWQSTAVKPNITEDTTPTVAASSDPSNCPSQVPSPTIKPNIIIDHTNWDWYNSQTQKVIDTVAMQKIYFAHASIGENIMNGFASLHTLDPLKYPLSQVKSGASPPETTINGTIYDYSRGNPDWATKVKSFKSYVVNGWRYPKINIAMNKLCAVDTYADWFTYCDSLASLEKSYPDTRFVYMTMPYYTGDDEYNVPRSQYNQSIRKWIATQSNKILLDIADIEAWNPSAIHQTFTVKNKEYEMLYSGYSSDKLHLNIGGGKRIATGIYSLFGKITSD